MNDKERIENLELNAAISLAMAAHTGQVDKGGQPYILHPLRVMSRVNTHAARVVAVLHDVAETHGSFLDNILNLFGDDIFDAIDAITRDEDDKTYRDYIKRVKENEIARVVKIADLTDNMTSSRMAALPAKERDSLMARYTIALESLERGD